MKLIFDFDDTLSNNKKIKERIFACLEEVGVLKNKGEQYYKEERVTGKPFSLKKFLTYVLDKENIKGVDKEDLYEKILQISPYILDLKLLDIVRKTGKENCYIVTNGEEEYQKDKINRSNIADLFLEIHVTSGSKKEIIEDICLRNTEETIIFVDNKNHFFTDLDMNKCPNLKTILYDENGLEVLMSTISHIE